MRLTAEGLKDALKKLGMNNRELASHLGVREEVVYHWIREKKRIPGVQARVINQLVEKQDALAASDGE